MRKRQKMVLSAIFLSLGLWGIQQTQLEIRYLLIGGLTVLTWLLSSWALREGLSGIEWLTVPLPLALFTAGVGLFYILLPPAWYAKLIIGLLFGVGQYALLLTANIFSVAAIRTIALLRAALAVGYAMTLLTGFFLFNTILSFRLWFWQTGGLVAGVGMILLLPQLWAVKLEGKLNSRVVKYSLVSALLIGLMAVAIGFWPISITVGALFLSTMLYIYMGVAQHVFMERLFTRTVWEYLTVGMVVVSTMLLTAGWGV